MGLQLDAFASKLSLEYKYIVNTKIVFHLSLFLGLATGIGTPLQAASEVQGAAYYSSSPGVAPKVYVCRKMEPVDGFIMPVELEDGAKISMDIRAIYALVDYNKVGLANVRNPADLKKLQDDQARLEKMAKDFPAMESWVRPKAKELAGEIALYEKGQRKMEGRWFTAEEIKNREEVAKAKEELAKLKTLSNSSTASLGAVTTKQGKTYSNFEVTKVDDTSVAIRHASGIARIPYKDMPEDLTVFPEAVRNQIQEKKKAWEAAQEIEDAGSKAEVSESKP